MQDFLTRNPITPSDEDVEDISRRKAVDQRRVEEQHKFYEIARKRAAELDVYMEQYDAALLSIYGSAPLLTCCSLSLLGSGKTSSSETD